MWGFSECQRVSDLLWNYAAHSLSATDAERVERHLSSCDSCREEVEQHRHAVDGLASIRRLPIPDSRRGWHELQSRLSEPAALPAPASFRWRTPPLALGSAVAAAAVF